MKRRIPALLAVAALLLALAWLLPPRVPLRWLPPLSIQLSTTPDPDGTLDHIHRAGIEALVQTLLESQRGATVVRTEPGHDLRPTTELPFIHLDLRPRREGGQLVLAFRWREGSGPWQEAPGRAAEPRAALEAFRRALPFWVRPSPREVFLPSDPEDAWALIEFNARSGGDPVRPDLRVRAEALARRHPTCATAWWTLGRVAFTELLIRANRVPEDRDAVFQALERCLEVCPTHAAAVGYLAQAHTDLGEPTRALEHLAPALRAQPRVNALLQQVAYSARCAGLLDVARRAVARRQEAVWTPLGIENTLLYLGSWDAFEAQLLAEVEATGWTAPAQRFYWGYATLLRGDRALAASRFHPAPGQGWSPYRFGRLARLYSDLCEGRENEARLLLQQLLVDHQALRAPDGEYTLKLAEAAALLGERELALDLASLSATHGFGCVAWYEQNPLLVSLRRAPRYNDLLQNLRLRQTDLQRRFPPEAFGL